MRYPSTYIYLHFPSFLLTTLHITISLPPLKMTAVAPTSSTKQLSIPLLLSAYTTLHIQTTCLETSTLTFLTTTDPSTAGSLSSLGSFVYAMPNVRPVFIPPFSLHSSLMSYLQKLNYGQRFQPSEPLSTALYTLPSSIDFATRVAKILAKRTELPAYVGCSVGLRGATVEEELEGVRLAVNGVIEVFLDKKNGG